MSKVSSVFEKNFFYFRKRKKLFIPLLRTVCTEVRHWTTPSTVLNITSRFLSNLSKTISNFEQFPNVKQIRAKRNIFNNPNETKWPICIQKFEIQYIKIDSSLNRPLIRKHYTRTHFELNFKISKLPHNFEFRTNFSATPEGVSAYTPPLFTTVICSVIVWTKTPHFPNRALWNSKTQYSARQSMRRKFQIINSLLYCNK